MALYSYQAISREGKRINGYIDASTLASARDQVSKMGLYPVKIELSAPGVATGNFFSNFFKPKINLKDKIFFTKQLAVLLKSGVPLLQSLDLLVDQSTGKLKNIVIALRDGLKEGRSLADELQKHPQAFDTIYIQLVRAGEATGKLEFILNRLSSFLEGQEELKKKIKGALRTPMIQLVAIILVVSGMLYGIVPKITEVFINANIQLPITTRSLIKISNAFVNYYYVILIIIIILIVSYRVFRATQFGRYNIDKIKLKLPIIGYFTQYGAIVQFSRTFGMLLDSGVNLTEALNIVVKIIDNKVLTEALEKAKENIIKQGKISQYLKETGMFPPLAIYLMKTGEESGQLGAMLLAVAQNYEEELSERASNLTSLITPIMLFIMGVIVMFIMLSIIQPISKLSQGLDANV